MAKRGWFGRIPIWARVSGIVTLVLAGVLAGSMLLGATDGGGHGTGHQSRTSVGGHGTGTHGSGGGRGHGGAGHTATTGG